MCKTTPLQHKIQKRTGNGDLIAKFLADTIEGKYSDAKFHHKLEAAKLLARYGSDQPESEESQFWGLIPTPEELVESHSRHSRENGNPGPLSPRERVRVRGQENTPSPSTGEGWDGGDDSLNPVTHLDILNYDIAHLIRQETAEGHTIAEFLSHVMNRRDQPFTPKRLRIKHTDRMAAAREILRRGHGHWGRKPNLKVYADDVDDTNDYDTLHTDLAKRMREYNEHGTDAARFLLDVMNDTSLDPEEAYTWHHKMSAAYEIIRRGWDTNYHKITPEMLQAYWQDQQSTRLSIGQKKQLAGLPTFLDEYDKYDHEDYEAIAQSIRDQEDGEVLSTMSLPPRRGKVRMGVNIPTPSHSESNEATTDCHPAVPGKSPLSPRERARVRGSEEPHHSPSFKPMSAPTDEETNFIDSVSDDLDCYYEPLTPEDQAIFNYNSLMESGEFEEGEITFVPPSEAAHRDYAIALKQIKEAAASEGVPLLPNPLAGTLHAPTIRGP